MTNSFIAKVAKGPEWGESITTWMDQMILEARALASAGECTPSDFAPDDFARLFRIDGIGQVLAVLEDGETDDGEECECLTLRIPDAGDVARITYSIKAVGMSSERGRAFTREIFDALTVEGVAKAIEPMVRAKASLLGEGLVVPRGDAV